MKSMKRWLTVMLAFSTIFAGFAISPQAQAAINDYVTVTKSVNPNTITTLEEAEVTLNITGTPPTNVILPNDVVLIIDKSGSMSPSYAPNNGDDKITNAKEAAKGFVDLMDMTKHRVAVVDFSSTTNIGSLSFTVDKDAAKTYINGISANGGTATGDAIDAALALLVNHRTDAQPVIVLMTDGAATEPSGNAFEYALQKSQAAKDAGVILYSIALLNPTDDPDTSGPNILLKNMATTANHHHFVLGSSGLNEIYAAIVQEIGMASAYDVTVTDIIDSNFEIVPGSYDNNIPKPTVDGNTLTWKFNELKNSMLSFKYKIRPVNKTKEGTFPISSTASLITYKDYAGAARSKAIPVVNLAVKLPAPEITSIMQPVGHPNGGETVTINGKYFVSGATVLFGTTIATNVVAVSDTQITVTVPKGAQGTIDVTVKNPDAQKAIGQYQYKADPIVTNITPSNGPLAGGTIVVIQGNYLMKGVSIKFADQPAVISLYSNITYLKVTAPQGVAPGPVDLTFTNPDGTSVVVASGYTYDTPPSTDPSITSISPNSGLVTGGTISYVDGKNFKSGMKIMIGSKEATTTYVSTTRFKVTIPASDIAGPVDVSVVNLSGNAFTLASGYTYNAIVYPTPTITSITPNSGLVEGGNIVYIDGTNYVSGLSKAYIGGKEALTTYVSATRLKVTIPVGDAAGSVDVKVVNDTNEATLAQGYEYTLPVIVSPTVTSVTPNTGLTSGGLIVYIDGTNFKSGATVKFGSTTVTSSYISTTRIKVTTPASATNGKVDLTVTNPDGGEGTLTEGFEYTAMIPTITGLTPNHANKAGGDIIYVDGTNFDSSSTVTVNGVSAGVTFVSNSRLKVTIPASPTVGDVPLVVTISNGQTASAILTYDTGPIVPAPSLTSMTATSGSAAGGNIIYIDGKNFTNKPSVYFGGVKAVTVTYVSSSRVKVTVPAGVSGPVLVKVVNPDGQESNTLNYTYN